MEINIAISAFLAVTIIYMLLIEIFAVLMSLTGISFRKSRFQVLSLITNTGYTTNESELIISEKSRRRLAGIIIVFGYIFSATIITLLLNIIVTIPKHETIVLAEYTYILFAIMVVIIIIFNIKPIKVAKRKALARAASKLLRKKAKNTFRSLSSIDDISIYEIYYHELPESLKNKSTEQITSGTETRIAAIKRNGRMIKPEAQKMLLNEDIVIVTGDKSDIKNLFLKEIISEKIEEIINTYR